MALTRVKYLGLSDVREMSVKDLKDAGVIVGGKLRWERRNGYTVHIDSPSERLLEIFREEGTFTVEEIDEESGKAVANIVKGSPMDDTGPTVVDATTGASSTTTGSTGRGRSTP